MSRVPAGSNPAITAYAQYGYKRTVMLIVNNRALIEFLREGGIGDYFRFSGDSMLDWIIEAGRLVAR